MLIFQGYYKLVFFLIYYPDCRVKKCCRGPNMDLGPKIAHMSSTVRSGWLLWEQPIRRSLTKLINIFYIQYIKVARANQMTPTFTPTFRPIPDAIPTDLLERKKNCPIFSKVWERGVGKGRGTGHLETLVFCEIFRDQHLKWSGGLIL